MQYLTLPAHRIARVAAGSECCSAPFTACCNDDDCHGGDVCADCGQQAAIAPVWLVPCPDTGGFHTLALTTGGAN